MGVEHLCVIWLFFKVRITDFGIGIFTVVLLLYRISRKARFKFIIYMSRPLTM